MKAVLIVLGVLLLVVLLFGGKLMGTRNDLVTQREVGQRRMVPGGCGSAAPCRSDPESGGDREGIRRSRSRRFSQQSRTRAPALLNARNPQEKIAREPAARQRARPAAGGRRELSAARSRMRISCGCRMSWRARRIALRSSGGDTTRRFSATTRASSCSRTTSPHRCSDSSATMRTSRRIRRRAQHRRKVSF